MKKTLFVFASLSFGIFVISCQNMIKEPTPQEEIVQHIDKDDDESSVRAAFIDPIYYRLKVKEPANNNYDQNHVIYWAYVDGVVNLPTGKDDQIGSVFTLAELKAMTAQTNIYLGKIAGKFTVTKANGGKIIARKLENRYIIFMQYDPRLKKAWVTHRFEGPSLFEAPNGVSYTQELFTLNWDLKPQNF